MLHPSPAHRLDRDRTALSNLAAPKATTSHAQLTQPTRLTHIAHHLQGAAAGEQRLTTTLKSITSIAGGGPAKTVSSGGGKINALAVSPDGNLVATVSQDGVCRLFDFGTGRLVGGFKVRWSVGSWRAPAVALESGPSRDVSCAPDLVLRACGRQHLRASERSAASAESPPCPGSHACAPWQGPELEVCSCAVLGHPHYHFTRHAMLFYSSGEV